jgi:acyl dehydratase
MKAEEPGMRVFTSLDEIAAAVGEELGTSEWLEVTQERVDQFAEATGDHQWIHVDVERAKDGPFGGTIAHGFLTLSMLAPATQQLLTVSDAGMTVNYGLDKVRFPAPLRVGAQFRASARVSEVRAIDGGWQMHVTVTVEVRDQPKPAAVAELLLRFYA